MHTPRTRSLLIAAHGLAVLMLLAVSALMIGPVETLTLTTLGGVGLVVRRTHNFCDDFARAQAFTTTPGQNGWTIKDTSSSGTPTYLCKTEDGGKASLTLAATDEEEVVTLYHNDVLAFDLRQVDYVECIAKVAGIDSATAVAFGLATEQNNTLDSVPEHAWFRIEGSASTSNVVVETDDGTNDNNDVATGETLGSTYKQCRIDFTNGLTDVRFYIDGERVAAGTTFDMSDLASGHNVQPFFQLQKASGTGTPSLDIARVDIQYRTAYGA